MVSGPIHRRLVQMHRSRENVRIFGAVKLSIATTCTAVKVMLNKSGEKTHPCAANSISIFLNHSPLSECLPGKHTLITSCNDCLLAPGICGGTPKQASTCHRRVRSTESYGFWRLTKHRNRKVLVFVPVSATGEPQTPCR